MEKIWLKSYPKGVPAEIDPTAYGSLIDLVEQSFAKYADRTAFLQMGRELTYRELEEKSRAFASWLQHEAGLQKGDRVALMMPNVLQYPIAIFGVLRAGMVVVNTNPLYTARELEHQLKDSGAKAILVLENFAHVLQEVIGQHRHAQGARHRRGRHAERAEVVARQLRRPTQAQAGEATGASTALSTSETRWLRASVTRCHR